MEAQPSVQSKSMLGHSRMEKALSGGKRRRVLRFSFTKVAVNYGFDHETVEGVTAQMPFFRSQF